VQLGGRKEREKLPLTKRCLEKLVGSLGSQGKTRKGHRTAKRTVVLDRGGGGGRQHLGPPKRLNNDVMRNPRIGNRKFSQQQPGETRSPAGNSVLVQPACISHSRS